MPCVSISVKVRNLALHYPIDFCDTAIQDWAGAHSCNGFDATWHYSHGEGQREVLSMELMCYFHAKHFLLLASCFFAKNIMNRSK